MACCSKPTRETWNALQNIYGRTTIHNGKSKECRQRMALAKFNSLKYDPNWEREFERIKNEYIVPPKYNKKKYSTLQITKFFAKYGIKKNYHKPKPSILSPPTSQRRKSKSTNIYVVHENLSFDDQEKLKKLITDRSYYKSHRNYKKCAEIQQKIDGIIHKIDAELNDIDDDIEISYDSNKNKKNPEISQVERVYEAPKMNENKTDLITLDVKLKMDAKIERDKVVTDDNKLKNMKEKRKQLKVQRKWREKVKKQKMKIKKPGRPRIEATSRGSNLAQIIQKKADSRSNTDPRQRIDYINKNNIVKAALGHLAYFFVSMNDHNKPVTDKDIVHTYLTLEQFKKLLIVLKLDNFNNEEIEKSFIELINYYPSNEEPPKIHWDDFIPIINQYFVTNHRSKPYYTHSDIRRLLINSIRVYLLTVRRTLKQNEDEDEDKSIISYVHAGTPVFKIPGRGKKTNQFQPRRSMEINYKHQQPPSVSIKKRLGHQRSDILRTISSSESIIHRRQKSMIYNSNDKENLNENNNNNQLIEPINVDPTQLSDEQSMLSMNSVGTNSFKKRNETMSRPSSRSFLL